MKKTQPLLHPKNKRKHFPKAPKGKHYAEEYEIECGEVLGGVGELPMPILDVPFERIEQIGYPTISTEVVPTSPQLADVEPLGGRFGSSYSSFGGSYSFSGGTSVVYEEWCSTCCFPLSPAPEPGIIWLSLLGLVALVTKKVLTKR